MEEVEAMSRYHLPMAKKPTSLLLDDERRAELKWLAGYLGISQAAVMALALGDFARKVRSEQVPKQPPPQPRKR